MCFGETAPQLNLFSDHGYMAARTMLILIFLGALLIGGWGAWERTSSDEAQAKRAADIQKSYSPVRARAALWAAASANNPLLLVDDAEQIRRDKRLMESLAEPSSELKIHSSIVEQGKQLGYLVELIKLQARTEQARKPEREYQRKVAVSERVLRSAGA